MVTVRCDFITGSDAQGCMVVLIGESGNTTVNLTRDDSSLCAMEALPLTMMFSHIFGFDIESDGSVGTLPVPGILTMTNLTEFDPLCKPNDVIQKKPIFLSECKFVLSDAYKLLN